MAQAADPNPGSVISDDHGDESLCADGMASSSTEPRPISVEELQEHNNSDGSFWAVIDGFVVDATDFLESHPGGLKKLLSTDSPGAGASGQPYGFSFSRGRNAHFPDTGKRFRKGVERYLGGAASGSDSWLAPSDVAFPRYGRLVILGKLKAT